MHSDPHRWLLARLLWRWRALFWIGPSLGLLAGVVLVFGFLKENETTRVGFDGGMLPDGVDVTSYLTDLRSELKSDNLLIAVQRQLDQDAPFLRSPLWWLRPRIKVDYMDISGGGWGVIHMRFTHHTASGREELSDAFEEVAMEAVPRIRAKYIGGWLEKIDMRLGEIRLAVKAAESRSEQLEGDIPFLDESQQLGRDREGLLLEEPYLGSELGLPGSIGSPAPWWKSPPKWTILILMCSGYGLMAVFPAVIVLEMMWPMRRTPEGAITEVTQ